MNCNYSKTMTNKISFLTQVLVALSLVSCNKGLDIQPDIPNDGEQTITLSADVRSMARTRVVDADVFTGTSADGMEATVWFSKECGVFEDNDNPQAPTFVPYRSLVKYDSGSPTTVYVDPQNKNFPLTYPINDAVSNDVYCVGLYPTSGWESADGTEATHAIDGKTDIMFADQIVGSWEKPFATQQYKHLLTWLKVEVKVAEVNAIEQWGAIEKLSVETSNSLTITFPTTSAGSSTVEYSTSKSEIDLLGGGSSLPLTITAQQVGSMLCAPSTSIRLKIGTEKVDEKIVDVVLRDTNGNSITSIEQTVGKLFIINIYFDTLNNIEATCSLIPWNEQNVDL